MKAFVYRWASALVVGYAVFIGSVGADSIIGQSSKPLDLPEFCQNLPRPEYASLTRLDYPNSLV